MKKLLLKFSLLNFILTNPMLAMINNCNQISFENHMEQQTTNTPFSWSNGNYQLSCMGRNLYVKKEGTTKTLKISDFEGKIIEDYFSNENNDVLFSTDKGLIFINKGMTKALKVNGITGTVKDFYFNEKNGDAFIFTKEDDFFIVKEVIAEALKVNGIIGTIERISFVKENKIVIYTSEDFFILEKGSTTATRIDPVTKIFMGFASKHRHSQSSSETYMEQQQTSDLKECKVNSWSNDTYIFTIRKKHLHVGIKGITTQEHLLRINGFNGKVIKEYFSSKNNDVFFATNKGLILIKEGSIDALRIKGFSDEIKCLEFIRKNDVIISTNEGLFILRENETDAMEIKGLDGEFDKIVVSDPDDKVFLCTNKGSFILNYPANALKTDALIVDPVSSFFDNYNQINVISNNYMGRVNSDFFNKENNYNFIYLDNNLYIIKKDSKKALKIEGISGRIRRIVFSRGNDFFVVATEFLFFVKEGTTIAIKQN